MKKIITIFLLLVLVLVACSPVYDNDPTPENDGVVVIPPPQSSDYISSAVAHGMYNILIADAPLALTKAEEQPTLIVTYSDDLMIQPAYFAISVAQIYPEEYYLIQLDDNPEYTLTASVAGENSVVFLAQPAPGLQGQLWQIRDNQDGSFSFILHGTTGFYLVFDTGVFRISNAAYENAEADSQPINDNDAEIHDENEQSESVVYSNFQLILSSANQPSRFTQHISSDGRIILNLGGQVQEDSQIPITTLREWVNDLQTAQGNFTSLVGHNPVDTITIFAYDTLGTPIVRSGEVGVMHFDVTFITEQLTLLAERRQAGLNDWNFWVLQELARVFLDPVWSFDSDLLARVMLIYVLEQNGAGVSPVGGEDVLFDATDIERAYYELGGGHIGENGFSPFGAAYTFVGIKRQVRWSAFSQTFNQLWSAPPPSTPMTRLEQFERFISSISRNDIYSRDILDLIDEDSMEALVAFYGGD